jgi:FADH2 O2-dependent halogenase
LLAECGVDQTKWPYHCDDAAVHQVLPDGWMWQLRFDDHSLSAGFMIDERPDVHPVAHTFSSPVDEWNWRIARTPFLSRQFRNAKLVRPESGLQKTARIQRLAGQGAGVNWAALTNTIGFVDPLHSTGIAHTLFSVSRVADILLTSCDGPAREQRLRNYSATMIGEICCVDEFVEGCYAAIPSFRLWCLWGMLYFAAATSMEQQSDTTSADVSFLRANDIAFREVLKQARHHLELASQCGPSNKAAGEKEFAAWLRVAISPWNHVGLFDESCDNLYSQTSAPVDVLFVSPRESRL